MNFNSHLDTVVLVAVHLVNVATPGERQGRPFDLAPRTALSGDVGAALRVASPRAADPPARLVRDYVHLATDVRPVFELVESGDPDGAASAVNRMLATYQPTPRLASHDGEPWHLHFHGPRSHDPTGWGGALATGLASVLGSAYAGRIGVCGAPVCDRVFVDVSRNGTRRFCSTACQNRVKAAAHRDRQRSGTT